MLLNNKLQIDDLFKEKVGVYAPILTHLFHSMNVH